MHDSDKLTVCIPELFDECPTWWQHMVTHLIDKHDPWHTQDNHGIIQTYLMFRYQADYPVQENAWQRNKITFPNKLTYCACVLEWS